MVSTATGTFRRVNRPLVLFGVIAVGVHISILFLPLRTDPGPISTPPTVIDISLMTQALETQTTEPEQILDPHAEEPFREEREVADTPTALSETSPEPEPTAEIVDVQPDISAAVLLHELSELKFPPPAERVRQLGVYHHQALPRNLTDPVLPTFSTAFSDDFAPLEDEIIDRWIEPGGTVNVVMRTRNGDTLCGSRAPFDPLNPLIEPTTMFRLCAGGGTRKPFRMKHP